MAYYDEPDDDWIEDEAVDDPKAELLVCPSCRRGVHEDSQQCPHCGDWITPVYPGGRARKWAFRVIIGMMILLMLTIALL